MQTYKQDSNNDIYISEVIQKQAVLCGFIFLSCVCIIGGIATKNKLGFAQTPEMKKLTYASVGKNNVMGVGDEFIFWSENCAQQRQFIMSYQL